MKTIRIRQVAIVNLIIRLMRKFVAPRKRGNSVFPLLTRKRYECALIIIYGKWIVKTDVRKRSPPGTANRTKVS